MDGVVRRPPRDAPRPRRERARHRARRARGACSDRTAVDVPIGTMMAHTRVSDDFVEFRQSDGPVITGVAYQTGPLNDKRMSSTRTTVVQAPKVIVSEPVDTLMCLLNVSTSLDYDSPVTMRFWILGPDGSRVARSEVTVPAFTYAFVSCTDVLESAGVLRGVPRAPQRPRDVPRPVRGRHRRPALDDPQPRQRRDRLRPHAAADVLRLDLGRRVAPERQPAPGRGVLPRGRARPRPAPVQVGAR